jgi:hypothetical protein
MSFEMREDNERWWQVQITSVAESYPPLSPARTIEEDEEFFLSLQECVSTYLHNAFSLLVGECDDVASHLLDRTVERAQEALRTESFERYGMVEPPGGLPVPGKLELHETLQPTPKMIRTKKLYGRLDTLESLHYALWFKTGERPMDMFRESLELRKEYYMLRKDGFERLLLNAVQAEDYEYVISWCRRKIPKAALPPKDNHFRRSNKHVLYVLSEYALGRDDLEPFARSGVDYWFEWCLDWVTPDASLPWWIRLGWAYLRGRHFTGVTDIRALIRELRGF